MKVNFCRGSLKHSSLVLATLLILALAFTDAHAGFNNWSSVGPVGKAYSVAVSTDGTTVLAGGNGSIYKNTVANGVWKLSLAGPLVDKGIVFKPGDALTAYAATTTGVYKTADGGVSWALLSGAPIQVKALAVDSASTADLYAGTTSGLFRSTDGGGTWSPINTGTPGSLPAGAVSAVAVTGSTIYAGTTAGVWKSSTSTLDWVDISSGAPVSTATITALAVDPADPANIYAAAGSFFYATLDGGANWSQPALFSTVTYASLAIDSVSTAPSTLYVGVIGTPTGLYTVSPANLSAWNSQSTSPPYSIAIAPNPAGLGFNNDLIFVGTNIGVLRNSDGFRTDNTGLSLPSILSVVETGGTFFAGGGEGVWSSPDLTSWTLKSLFGPPPRISTLAPNPSLSADIFAGVRQAGSFQSFQTIDSGVLWSPVTRDAGSGTEVVAIVRDAINSYMAVAGDGVYYFFNGSLWQLQANNGLTDKNLTGLSLYSVSGLWATSPGGIYLSTDGAANWALKKTGAYTSIAATATRIIAGRSGGIDVSTDNGATWSPLNFGTSDVTSIGVHSTNDLVAVFGTAKDGTFLTVDGGVTVQPFASGLPALGPEFPAVNSVSFNTSQPSLVTIGLEGAGVYKRNLSPLLETAPATLDFGTQLTGSNTILPITIKNSGLLPLNVSSILRTITGGPPFAIGYGTCSTPPFVLNPGQSCAIDVTYSPVAPGASPADNVNIYTDAPGSPNIIPITGQSAGSAPTKIWASPVSGSWSVAANWSPAGVPQSTDVVAINLDGTYTVTADTPATVAGLIVGAASGTQTLSIPATTLTLNGNSSFGNRGVLTLSGGTLDGTGQVDLYGTLNWNGDLKGTGTFNLQAGATGIIGSSPNTYLETKTFNNYGTITYSGTTSNSIQFYTAATFNNYGTFVTQSFGSLIDVSSSGSTFNNLAGAIFRKTTDTNTTNIDMPFNNSGSINTKTGTISLNKASSHSGILAIDNGTTLAMAGLSSHSINSGISLVGAGTLSFSGGSTITLNADLTNSIGAMSVNDATINGPGKLVNAAGKSLTLAKATINSALDNSGSIMVNGSADSAINGALTTFSGSTLTVDATSGHRTLTVASGFTNYGTIELNSSANQWNSTLAVTSGPLTNAASGVINALQGSGGTFYRYLNTELNNQGTITASWPLFINKASASHSNIGTINANEGITVTQSGTAPAPTFTNNGTIAIAATKTFTVSGGSFSNSTGSVFSGSGSLALTGATAVTLNIDLTNTVGAISVNDATINGPAKLINPVGKSLTLAKATINSALDNSGTILVNGTADSAINGNFTTLSGSLLTVDATTGHRTLTLASGFTNFGTIELNSSSNQWNATLAVTAGTLVNAASGVINALQGSGGTYYRYLNAELNNQGTITASWPLFIDKASAAHSNSGTINVNDSVTVTQSGTAPAPTFTNTGTIAIAATKDFTVSGGNFVHNSGASYSGTGLLAFTGGTVTLNDMFGVTVSGLSLNNSTVSGFYNLVNPPGKTLTMSGSSLNVPLYNDGTTIVNGSADSTIKSMFTSSTSLLQVDATSNHRTLTLTNGFTNYGTIELNSSSNQWNATLAVTSGPLTNAAGATINALQGSGGTYYRYLNAELNNQGTITASWPLFISKASAAHSNSGTINANDNVTVTQSGTAPAPSFTNTGTIAIAATKTFTVSGGGFSNDTGATFSGSGSLAFTGAAAVTLNIDLTNTVGAISVNDATFNGPGKLVNAAGKSLTLAKATINSALDNSGSIMVNGSADSAINGALTTFSGSTLTVDATSGHRTLTVASGFTNFGAINLNSSANQWNTYLSVTSGTLTNATGANINALQGIGGTYYRYLNAELNNQGTITASWPLFIDKASAAHSNSGTINVNDSVTVTQSGTAPAPSFTNSGVINIAATKTLTVSGGSFNHNSPGTLQGTGILDVSGTTFTSGGAIHPNIGGNAGTFSITGTLAANATDSLNIDIGGTAAGTYDLLTVSDTAGQNGNLNVNLINSYVPSAGDSFTFLTCGTACSGTFSTTNLPALTGAVWNIAYGANATTLTVNATQTITATAASFGSITPSGTTVVTYGGNQAYTITPNTGYHIVDVTVDGIPQGAISNYTFSNVTANHTISASFAPDGTSTTISGTVSYGGARSGRIYISMSSMNGTLGTSISAPGAFTIRGVPPGTYMLNAFMDSLGTGSSHASDLAGTTTVPVTVGGTPVSGISITMTDPLPLTTVQTPANLRVYPADSGALVQWNPVMDLNGAQADSYSIYWDTTPSVSTASPNSKQNIPAIGDKSDLLLGGLTNGTYYFIITAKSGSVTSLPSAPFGPVTIGQPTGGNQVSGTVTFPAVANGKPLYLAIGNNNGTMFPAYISAATTPQNFTVYGVPNGTYRLFAVVDTNNDGLIGLGDYKVHDINAPMITVNNAAVSGQSLTLGSENSIPAVMTGHFMNGATPSYMLHFEIFDGLKKPAAVTLTGGVNVNGPIDLGLSNWGSFYYLVNLGTTIPAINDSYLFDITYTDGSSDTGLSGKVTGVVSDFATALSPSGNASFTATPTLSWTEPANKPSTGGYEISLNESGGATGSLAWDSNMMPFGQNSAVFNFDGKASAPNLTNGKTYNWDLIVFDQQMNYAISSASFSFAGISPSVLQPATVSSFYSQQLSTSGGNGNYTWSILSGLLPSGLSLDTNTGIISGIPTAIETQSFTIQVADNAVTNQFVTTQNYSLSVTAPVTYTITASSAPAAGGSISPPGTTNVNSGSGMLYYFMPNPGYHIANVLIDGVSQGAISGYTFSNVTANHTIDVTFAVTTNDISGTVSYSGSKTGRIYLAVDTPQGVMGTSIASPGTYTIRGLPLGTFQVRAFMDSLNLGTQVQSSPAGTGSVSVTAAGVTPLNLVISDTAAVTPPAPINVTASAGDKSVLIDWDKDKPNGIESADSYDIFWGTTAAVSSTSFLGKRSGVPAGFDSPAVVDGLTNGDQLYFVVAANSGGNQSGVSQPFGPVTIGAPTGGYSVSGTLSYTGPAATGPLHIAIVNPATKGAKGIYYTTIPAPTATNSFTVTGVPDGDYVIYSIIDMNNDKLFGSGDVMTPDNKAPLVTVAGAPVSGLSLSLAAMNSEASLRTDHHFAGASEFFNIEGEIRGQLKRPVTATLTAAPAGYNFTLPMDLGIETKNGSGTFRFWTGSPSRPVVGDSFTLSVTYADGSTDNAVTASVSGVNDSFPTNPQVTTPVTTVPTFSWGAPASPPANYRYSLYVWTNSNNGIWDAWDLPKSMTSVVYGATGSMAQPLLTGTTYNWNISTEDKDGNRASVSNSFVPLQAGAPLIFWQTPAPISYGTPLSAAQLNATAQVPGTFSYTPAVGTVLNAGAQSLTVTFTPTDSVNYLTATATVNLTVNQVTPVITWTAPAAITSVTLLSATQLNATASVPGTFTYSPASGTTLAAGTQTLTVTFTPTDSVNYASATASVSITVNLPTFTLTATAAAGGTISPAGATSVLSGNSQAYTITPSTGYHIVDVRIDGVSQGAIAACSFTAVTADHTIDATFAVDTFTITATANSGGTITPAGGTTLNYGTSQSYTITPDAGFVLIDLRVDQTSVGKLGSYTFNNITAGHSIEAVFGADGVIDPSNTTGVPQIGDALIVLTAALGDATLTPAQIKKIDTAPIVNGVPQPDGNVDLLDVLMILRRIVGLEKW